MAAAKANADGHFSTRLPPGEYRLRVALLDPRTGQPALRLAIAGRQSDGWYDLSAIQVR